MKSTIAIAIGILSALCVPILAQHQTSPAEQKEVHVPGAEISDAEILASLIAVNEHEIASANSAIQKKGNQQVAHYADMMNKDHNKNLVDTKKLAEQINIQPNSTPDVEQLKSESVTARSELSKLSGKAFDDAYLDQMVRDHSKVLEMIDIKFMTTTNAQLQEHLKKTRDDVARHLEEAKRIQDEIK